MRSILASLSVFLLGGAAVARAEEPPEPPRPPEVTEPPGERAVLPAKRLYVRASLDINLSADAAGDPVSLSPDVFYGVTRDLTVGLVHSTAAATGFIGRAGSSLCLTGDACDGVYNSVGADGRYHLVSGKVSAAASFGLYATDLDPLLLVLKLGAVGRYRPSPESKLAVDFAPSLFIGLTERDPAMAGGETNKELLAVPVTVVYAAAPRVNAMVQTGVAIPFAAAGDAFFVPLSIGASYQVDKQISVEAAFSLLHLLGGEALPTGFDGRSFTIGGGYAF